METSKTRSRRLLKNSALLYFRMLIIMLIGLYTSRVVLKELGITDYGLYNVVGGIVTLFSFVQQALGNASWRYITVELGKEDFARLQETYSTTVILHILFSLFVVLLAETIGLWFLYNRMNFPMSRIYEVFWVYQLSVVNIVIMIMSSPSTSLITAHEHMGAFAYISIYEVLMKLGIVYVIGICNSRKLVVYAILLCIVQASVRLIYAIYCRRHFPESRVKFIYNKNLIKEISCFSGYTLLPGLGFACCGQGLNVLLNIFFGPVANAARGISVQIQNLVMNFIRSFQQAANPQITKLYAGNEIESMHRLVVKTAKFSFYMLLIPILPLMIRIKPILEWWLVEVPTNTCDFCRWSLAICLIESISYPFLVGGAANGNVKKMYTFSGLILISILPISYVALKMGYPPVSVYVVHFVLAVLLQCVRISYGAKLIHFRIRRIIKEVLYPITVTTFLAVPPMLWVNSLFTDISFVGVMASVGSTSICTCVIIAIFGVTKEEKAYIRQLISSHISTKLRNGR